MGLRCISFTLSDSLFLTMQLASETQSTTDCGGDTLDLLLMLFILLGSEAAAAKFEVAA